jgi:hypothetical protein
MYSSYFLTSTGGKYVNRIFGKRNLKSRERIPATNKTTRQKDDDDEMALLSGKSKFYRSRKGSFFHMISESCHEIPHCTVNPLTRDIYEWVYDRLMQNGYFTDKPSTQELFDVLLQKCVNNDLL